MGRSEAGGVDLLSASFRKDDRGLLVRGSLCVDAAKLQDLHLFAWATAVRDAVGASQRICVISLEEEIIHTLDYQWE